MTAKVVQVPAHKKEFVAKWNHVELGPSANLSVDTRNFLHPHFNKNGTSVSYELYVPEGIHYRDLAKFFGYKTRVTIEVIE